jgi:hypothetical protein
MSELHDLVALIRANTPLIVIETRDEAGRRTHRDGRAEGAGGDGLAHGFLQARARERSGPVISPQGVRTPAEADIRATRRR